MLLLRRYVIYTHNLTFKSSSWVQFNISLTLIYQVPQKLRKIFLKGIDEGAQIKVMPLKRMSATLSNKKGVIVLGDAFNMRHPAIASGMMVLLSDILILRRLLQPLEYLGDVNKVSEVIKSFYVIRKVSIRHVLS